MAIPISLFDPELIPFGWFDTELTAAGWFDDEFSYTAPSPPSVTHSVYYIYSYDEGITWHAEALIGTGMYYYYNATNHRNDDRIRAWFQYDSGTSGTGTAYGQYRRHTDSAWSASFQFKNAGVAISIADGGMCNIEFTHSNQNELTWSPVLNGDTTPTTWFSNDEGRTWRKQT
jgi:hypothetical protein